MVKADIHRLYTRKDEGRHVGRTATYLGNTHNLDMPDTRLCQSLTSKAS